MARASALAGLAMWLGSLRDWPLKTDGCAATDSGAFIKVGSVDAVVSEHLQVVDEGSGLFI